MICPLLEVRKGTKRFPGVTALEQVDLSVQRGEVLAVIGENGAGKSTLMKVLAGEQRLDAGEIILDGHPVRFDSVRDSLHAGVALIHQELNLSDNLSVGANIFLGREPQRFGWIDHRTIDRDSRQLLKMIGLDVSPGTLVRRLTIGQQQMIEIAKALSVKARVLIMDEPTSSLAQSETQRLFHLIGQLRDRGVCIIYISHRLSEVDEIADRVLVLRDGKNAGHLSRDEMSHHRMVELMVGRDVGRCYRRTARPFGDVVLDVDGLTTSAFPRSRLSFSVRAGEILGLAGLVGSGRTELLRSLFHIDLPLSGTIRMQGQLCKFRSARDAIRAGMALVPEDRKQQGLILEMAVRANLSLAALQRNRRGFGFLNRYRESIDTDEMIFRLRIKTPGPDQVVQFLSGGNQQKVVLGKWLTLRPQLLLLDEPTRGVDVGAKQEIYGFIEQLAKRGVAVVFVSSEMEEIVGLADRVLVLHEGRLAGQLQADEHTDREIEKAIMELATGQRSGSMQTQ